MSVEFVEIRSAAELGMKAGCHEISDGMARGFVSKEKEPLDT